MLCDPCAWTNDYPEDTSHRWWHTLLPLVSRVHEDELASTPPSPSTSTSAQINEPKASMDNLDTEIVPSKPLDMLQATDAFPSLSDPGLLSGVVESVQSLDDRMSSLEGKVGVSQASVEKRMGALENRMASVEGKLDALLGELQKGMEAILART